MRVIIAGSRHLNNLELVEQAVAESGFDITEVVSGKEPKGIDHAGEVWAEQHGIPVTPFLANWKRYGRAAGPRRNQQMAEYGEALIAIPHPTLPSRGTWDMVKRAEALGLEVYIFEVDDAAGKAQPPDQRNSR